MIKYVFDWYKLYDPIVFVYHKAVHVVAGALIGYLGCLNQTPITGIVLVLICAIGKELADEYQSHAPFYAHTLDVIITVLGGLLGVLVYALSS
jgi:hypothetical protein